MKTLCKLLATSLAQLCGLNPCKQQQPLLLCLLLQLTNIAGKRYGVHPTTSTERYKGQSQVRLADADPESRKSWKTTNQVFQASAQPGVTDVVGLANAGISSDIARRLHKTQGIYDL